MVDSDIQEGEPSLIVKATEHHWDEINRHGETTFHSDEENRTISMDQITADCMNDFAVVGLYENTHRGLDFIKELRGKIRALKNKLMDEALNDYYG